MARPRLKKLAQLRRQAARSGNQKRFSNLTNRIREKRGLGPLSNARKNKMFKRLGGPDNTTFNRPGMPGAGGKRRPLPGGGRIMKGPQQQGPRVMPENLGLIGNPIRPRQQGPNNIPGVTPNQGGPIPNQGRPFMPTMSPQTGSTMRPQKTMEQTYTPGSGRQLQGPLAFKDGGEVESMPMGERPYKEEKGKKNSMRGVGKAIQGTKFKGVL